MVSRPAKNPSELVTMFTEMDKKIRFLHDIMDVGDEIHDIHKKSVLVGILDPITLQQTAAQHDFDYEKPKVIIQNVSNSMTSATTPPTAVKDPDAMKLGQFASGMSGQGAGDEQAQDNPENLNASGRGMPQCSRCKGWDHLKRDCPNKVDVDKGKGRGKDNRALYGQKGGIAP